MNDTVHRLTAALSGRYRLDRELGAGGRTWCWRRPTAGGRGERPAPDVALLITAIFQA